jgi:superfamily II DNA helicase RecQ
MFEMDGAVASRCQQFGVSSIIGARFLAIQSGMEVVASQKRKGEGFEDEADVGQRKGWARLQQMKMRRQFGRMMKLEAKEGRFRGVQEPGIEVIQGRVKPVAAVMATGTGNSVLFMLPGWAEPGGRTR